MRGFQGQIAHLRDSVRLKWRQSEARKSWSRSLSSSSLAPPGKAVRFLKESRGGSSQRLPGTGRQQGALGDSNFGSVPCEGRFYGD